MAVVREFADVARTGSDAPDGVSGSYRGEVGRDPSGGDRSVMPVQGGRSDPGTEVAEQRSLPNRGAPPPAGWGSGDR